MKRFATLAAISISSLLYAEESPTADIALSELPQSVAATAEVAPLEVVESVAIPPAEVASLDLHEAVQPISPAPVTPTEELAPQVISTPDMASPIQPISPEIPSPSALMPTKNSFVAVGLSFLAPGLGHTYLGDLKTASGLLGSAGLEYGIAFTQGSYKEPEINSLILAQSTSLYGIYAAYRDVRNFNRNSGYLFSMPNNSLVDLTFAPFQWSVLKKPEVWGGLLGSLAVAATIIHFLVPEEASIRPPTLSLETTSLFPLVAFPIGIGEEAFFRGFLQPAFSEMTSSPWGGIALSSLAFGAAHIPNALAFEGKQQERYLTFVVPMITAAGAYYGWVTQKNQSLKESVALHAWYDFILLGAHFAATKMVASKAPTTFGWRLAF